MAIEIGDIVGDYRVVDVIGAGGMGAVYKVEHCITKRIEAMKALSTGLGISEEEVLRFEREIQVQARMQHPNIAGVYSAVRYGRWLALVMEHVEGESLRDRLRRERLPRAAALAIASDILAALDCAHRNGVVHGDVSPANILITPSGGAKLTDFGVAREALRDPDSAMPVGTPDYMSPEQVRGLAVDHRSDIYAAGAVLYEMLTGRKLFAGDSGFAILRAQVEETPAPPRAVDRGIPAALDAVVMRALAKDPDRRFQTAAQFRDAVAALAVPRNARRPLLIAFAAVAVVAACGAAIIRTKSVPAIPTPAPAAPPVAQQAAPPPASEPAPEPALEPAGKAPPRRTRDPEVKPWTVHHLAERTPASAAEPAHSPPAAPPAARTQSAGDSDPGPLPEISAVPGAGMPQAPIGIAEPPKPPSKQPGNRFVRALGKINPFRRAPKPEEKQQ